MAAVKIYIVFQWFWMPDLCFFNMKLCPQAAEQWLGFVWIIHFIIFFVCVCVRKGKNWLQIAFIFKYLRPAYDTSLTKCCNIQTQEIANEKQCADVREQQSLSFKVAPFDFFILPCSVTPTPSLPVSDSLALGFVTW